MADKSKVVIFGVFGCLVLLVASIVLFHVRRERRDRAELAWRDSAYIVSHRDRYTSSLVFQTLVLRARQGDPVATQAIRSEAVALTKELRETATDAECSAVQQLILIGPLAIEPLISSLKDHGEYHTQPFKKFCGAAPAHPQTVLAALGQSARPALIHVLSARDVDIDTRARAAGALAQLGADTEREAISALEGLLAENDWKLRLAAAFAFLKIGNLLDQDYASNAIGKEQINTLASAYRYFGVLPLVKQIIPSLPKLLDGIKSASDPNGLATARTCAERFLNEYGNDRQVYSQIEQWAHRYGLEVNHVRKEVSTEWLRRYVYYEYIITSGGIKGFFELLWRG